MSDHPDRFVLVLAGGRGERFWPWSRPERPKQLLPLARDGATLLASTYARALRLVAAPDRIVVMTASDLVPACRRECPGARVLGEPMMRNTAPAIAAAAYAFPESSAFAVLPSDHRIEDEDAFVADMTRAFEVAEREAVLVTFGIRPRSPETGFGYVKRGQALGPRLYRVARFTEKPDRARAEAWVQSGEYYWNSGMFVWRKRTFFDALDAGRPAIAAALRDLKVPGGDDGFADALRPVFEPLESISVDYAVLESAPNTLVFDATFDWDDLGSWGAWASHQPRDARGNVLFGEGAVALDCDGCVVVAEGGAAAAMGLKDMVVVHVNGATLSCRLADSDGVRKVTEAVRAKGIR